MSAELYPGATVSYSFEVYGLEFDTFKVNYSNDNIEKVVFNKPSVEGEDKKTKCIMKFEIGPVSSIEEADALAETHKEQFLNNFAFAVNHKIGEARICAHNLTPQPSDGSCGNVVVPIFKASGTGNSTIPIDEGETVKLIEKTSVSLTDQYKIGLYKTSMQTEDAITRFLLLYLIVASYTTNDEQKKIDGIIKKIRPSTPESRNPKNQGKETCYTRLRNEIMHKRPDINFADTKQEVYRRLDEFQRIVREIIIQHL